MRPSSTQIPFLWPPVLASWAQNEDNANPEDSRLTPSGRVEGAETDTLGVLDSVGRCSLPNKSAHWAPDSVLKPLAAAAHFVLRAAL